MSENHYAEFSECSMKPQEVLEYVSGPIPVPEEGEVLVRMKAAPINPADINFVQGVYGLKPVLPHSRAGLEGCGVVQESRAEGFREGDEVILLRGVGSWSEYVAVPSVNVMKLPVKVDPVQAAMLKVNPLTALRMLEGFVSLEPGDWLVQNAANSGVGRCIIQLAREMGVKTVNFVRRPDELRDELTALGADLVVGEDDGDVVKNTLARLDGKRPVLASNAVGGESALRLMDMLAPGGSMVTYGAMSRKSIKVTQWLKNAPVSEIEAAYEKLARLMADGRLKQAVDTVYPLSDVRKAVEKAQEEFRSGKVVLSMDCA